MQGCQIQISSWVSCKSMCAHAGVPNLPDQCQGSSIRLWPYGEDRFRASIFYYLLQKMQCNCTYRNQGKEKPHLYPNFLVHFVHTSNRPAGSVGRASPDARFVDSRYDQSWGYIQDEMVMLKQRPCRKKNKNIAYSSSLKCTECQNV